MVTASTNTRTQLLACSWLLLLSATRVLSIPAAANGVTARQRWQTLQASRHGSSRGPSVDLPAPSRVHTTEPGDQSGLFPRGFSGDRRSLLRAAGAFPGFQASDCSMHYAGCKEIGPLLKFKAANIDPFGLLNWTIPCSLGPGQTNKEQAKLSNIQQTPPSNMECGNAISLACRTWIGVTCNPKSRVISLNVNPTIPPFYDPEAQVAVSKYLWGNWSVGQSIPPEIGDLAELTSLDLSYNYPSGLYLGGLIGTIPDSLSKLTKLSSLNLQFNRIWGSIPGSLSTLVNLQYMQLQTNNLTGSIPSELGNLKNLTKLSLGSNPGMGGTLPQSLGGLLSLQELALSSIPMTGSIPDTFSKLTNLVSIDFSNMDLEGQLPSWLGSLTGLFTIFADKNRLEGSIPSTLSALQGLATLSLAYNKLSDSIPTSFIRGICQSEMLTIIELAGNSLTGPFPYGLSKCKALDTISLGLNKLTGEFPPKSFFQAMPALTAFLVNDNRLSGPVPVDLTSNSSIYNLLLGGNQLTGPPPKVQCLNSVLSYNFSYNSFSGPLDAVLDMSSLNGCKGQSNQQTGSFETANVTLDLSHNAMTGSVPKAWLSLPEMQSLQLNNNNLGGSIPEGFNCSKLLQAFSVSSNNIAGSIPSALGSCTGLQSLTLAYNKLSGTLPQQLVGIGASLQNLELQQNSLAGSVPASFNNFQQLRFLNLSQNALSGSLHPNISQLPNLVRIDLSRNQISGPLPEEMGNLTILNFMDMHSNALSGPIPITIAPPNLPLLTYLDLSSNTLSGSIPWGFTNTSATNLTLNFASNNLSGAIPGGSNSTFALTLPDAAVAGNPGLCGGSGYPPCPDPYAGQLSTGALIGICVGAAIALVGIGALTYWLIRKRNEWAGGTMLVFEKLDFHLTVDDILEATENFSDKFKLGRGGFGTVYSATLQDGRTVAIKRLAAQSTQGDREFQAEMQTLGNIRHRNLVVLVAAYIAPPPSSERLLVYNFLSGGSLDNILGSSTKEMGKDSPYRQWEVRRRIALDVARGMKYLHHDCTPRIIHRDMKPANVLMDDQLVAHVADFGLAREVDATKSHMSTAVFGTIGYLAPEYTQRGRLTFKSDVFAYGVLLLQLITGKQPTDEDVAERGLARWVGASNTGSVIDDRMETGPYTNQILGAIKLGLLCTSRVPADRPSMAEVVHLLENLDDFAKGITAPEDALGAAAPAEEDRDEETG